MSQLLKVLRRLSEELGYITLEEFLIDLIKEYYEQQGKKLREEELRDIVRYKLCEDLLKNAVNKVVKEFGFRSIDEFLGYVNKIEKMRSAIEKLKVKR